MQHHNYSLSEIEMMMPWEREVYLTMFMEHLRDEEERQRQQQQRKR